MKDDFSILITLSDGQDGYAVVADYIRRYWNHHAEYDETVIIYLETSHDGRKFYPVHDVASPITPISYLDGNIEFGYDWWEGEKYIRIKGIKSIGELDIEGGIYSE